MRSKKCQRYGIWKTTLSRNWTELLLFLVVLTMMAWKVNANSIWLWYCTAGRLMISQTQVMLNCMKHRLKSETKDGTQHGMRVFYDYCSFYQKPQTFQEFRSFLNNFKTMHHMSVMWGAGPLTRRSLALWLLWMSLVVCGILGCSYRWDTGCSRRSATS